MRKDEERKGEESTEEIRRREKENRIEQNTIGKIHRKKFTSG